MALDSSLRACARLRLLATAWVGVLASASAIGATVNYSYDEAGRLVQVQSTGGSAVYAYDTASNLVSVSVLAASAVGVAEFSPNAAPVGATVTITGSGFSATAASNVVKFNGVAATVTSASSSSLSVVVPAGATSGPLSVTVGSNTGSSASAFQVLASSVDSVPTASSLSLQVAAQGTSVTINGSNFAGSGTEVWVRVNGQPAVVTSVTATQIVFTVPTNAASGLVEVGTRGGTGVVAGYLYVAPTGKAATDIGANAALSVDGAALTASVASGKTGLFVFDGKVGQAYGLGFSSMSFSPSGGTMAVSVLGPDGSTVVSCTSVAAAGNSCDVPPLPTSGTYTVMVTPSSGYAANATLTLSTDVPGSLTLGGAPKTFSVARMGQNARYTFDAVAGEHYSLNWNGTTIPGSLSYIYVYRPDGSLLTSAYFDNASYPFGRIDLRNVSLTGRYTVLISPYGTSVGQVNVALNATATIAVDGAVAAVNAVAGQNANYTFNGTAGQRLGLGWTAFTTSPSGTTVAMQFLTPDGSLLATCNAGSATGSCNVPALPRAGKYTIVVNAAQPATVTGNLTLSNDLTGTLTANAAATTFSTSRAGQNARYTFNATAGQDASLVWSSNTFPGTYTYIYIYKPDGTQQAASYFTNDSSANGTIDLRNLPASGVYTVFVDPAGAGTGSVGVQLLADAPGSLAVDGAALPVSLARGQNGDYTFSGTAGQRLGLGVSVLSTTPAGGNVNITVIAPDDVTVIKNCSSYTASGGNCNLPVLPRTGTYTVRVVPQNTYAASLTLTLSNDVSGTLTANAAATTFSTNRVGQNARYTFNATAGQDASLVWSGNTFPGTYSYIYIYKPDGTQLTYGYFSNDSSANGTIDLRNLPASGVYTVFVDPAGAGTGSVGVQLLADAPGSLAVDGAALPISLAQSQNGDYTFSGTTGQRLGLGVSALSTTPAGGNVRITIYAPDDVTLIKDCSNYTASGGNCNLPALPSTGTYTVRVVPQNTYAASLTLTLSNDVSSTLTANAAATTFSTSRVGQNARYTFNATAGQDASVAWSNNTFPGTYTYIYIYKPDGTQLTYGYFSNDSSANGAIDLHNLSATGTYTVFVDPAGAGTGSIGIQLLGDAAGSLTVDGSSLTVSQTANQFGSYTFSGAAGQRLGLGVSAQSTAPAGGYARVTVYAPDDVTLIKDCSNYSTGGSCNLPALPSAGTYTIRVVPQSGYATSLTLTLSTDATANLVAGGSAATFSTARVGQNAFFSFNATAGQNLNLSWSGSTLSTSTALQVLRPDGSSVTSTSISSATGSLNLNNVSATGTYSVFVDPYAASVGAVTLQLAVTGTTTPGSQTSSGTVSVDGSTVALTAPASQTTNYTFSGTIGQRLGIGVTGLSTSPAGGYARIAVYLPDNITMLVDCSNYYAGNGSCNVPPLPSTGTYTVRVTPGGAYSASLSLTLSSDFQATLTAGGATQVFNSTRAGQNARYTFTATAGQNMSLLWTGNTFTGSSSSSLYVYKPDGTQLTSTSFSDGSPGTVNMKSLPMTGTYAVFFDPANNSSGTGSIGVKLLADATGTLQIDGASLAVSQAAGQNGSFTFSGTAGQRLGLGVTTLATTPSGSYVYVSVLAPDNTSVLVDCSSFSSPNSCNIPPLPSTGTYTVRVVPRSGYAADLTLLLSSDVQSVLTANAAGTTFTTSRVGQNARYTFNATAGQNASLLWTGNTFAGYYNTVVVFKPDGTQLNSTYFSDNPGKGSLSLKGLPASGSYAVFLDPYTVSTGTVSLQLLADAPGTLAVDGASLAVTQVAGQNGSYTFTGSAGQRLGLGVSALTTVPAGSSVNISVFAPDGSSLVDCSSFSASGGNCNLPVLPAAGTYTVRVVPQSTYGANLTLTLSADVQGTLTANASATTFTTARVGQNARYTFGATSGQDVSVAWSAGTFPGSYNSIYVYDPTGATVASEGYISDAAGGRDKGSLVMRNLPADGTYTVFVDPYLAGTGSLNLQLLADDAQSLAVDGAALNATLSTGQNGEYTFSGTQGQQLGLGINVTSTTPSGGYVNIKVYTPDDTTVLFDCSGASYYAPGGSCNLPALPYSGTYKVRVTPGSIYGTTLSLVLSSDAVSTMTVNGSATTYSSTRVGQNGRFSFTGVQDGHYVLTWSGSTLADGASALYVYAPDGTLLGTANINSASYSSGRLRLPSLPVDGTYTVVIDPTGVSVGQVILKLTDDTLVSSVDLVPSVRPVGLPAWLYAGWVPPAPWCSPWGQAVGRMCHPVRLAPYASLS